MRGYLFRSIIVIAFGLVTFFPNFGLLAIGVSLFPTMPAAVIVAAAIWLIGLALFLPISVRQFRRVSVVALLVVLGVALWAAMSSHLIDPLSTGFWMTWGITGIFGIFAWLLVATPLWRFFHAGVVATQDTEPHHAN